MTTYSLIATRPLVPTDGGWIPGYPEGCRCSLPGDRHRTPPRLMAEDAMAAALALQVPAMSLQDALRRSTECPAYQFGSSTYDLADRGRRGVGDCGLSPQENDAARENEDQEQHEADDVEDQPERGDHAAEAKGLKEEHESGNDRHPSEPAWQDAAL